MEIRYTVASPNEHHVFLFDFPTYARCSTHACAPNTETHPVREYEWEHQYKCSAIKMCRRMQWNAATFLNSSPNFRKTDITHWKFFFYLSRLSPFPQNYTVSILCCFDNDWRLSNRPKLVKKICIAKAGFISLESKSQKSI